MSSPGGYPVEILIKEGIKYICWICSKIFRDPVQNICGHRFCRTCLSEASPETKCRGCEEEGEESLLVPGEFYPDPAIARELGREPAHCTNKGCPWTGKFREYVQHEETCDYVRFTCECGAVMSRDDVTDHQENKCPLKQCPFGCEDSNTPDHQASHTTKHLAMLLTRVNQLRSSHSEHEGAPGELSVLLQKMDSLEKQVETLNKKLEEARPPGGVGGNTGGAGDAGGTGVRGNTGRAAGSKSGASAPCYRGYPYYEQQPNVVAASSLSVTPTQPPMDLPPGIELDAAPTGNHGNLVREKLDTLEALLSVLNTEVENMVRAQAEMSQRSLLNRETMETLQTRVTSLERSLALKDVALAEKELRLRSLETTSYDGVLVWPVTDFSRKRQEAVSGRTPSIYSSVFYTSRAGYKCCARLYLNGDGMGKGSHISLFFVVMRGQYDAILPWPFKQKVTLMLLDQNNREHVLDAFRPDPTSSSFRRPQSDMNIASGVPLFCPLSKLDDRSNSYVKDDTIFVKIIVESDLR